MIKKYNCIRMCISNKKKKFGIWKKIYKSFEYRIFNCRINIKLNISTLSFITIFQSVSINNDFTSFWLV